MSFTEKILRELDGNYLTSWEVFDRVPRVAYMSVQTILKNLCIKKLAYKYPKANSSTDRCINLYTISDEGRAYLLREKKTIVIGVEERT